MGRLVDNFSEIFERRDDTPPGHTPGLGEQDPAYELNEPAFAPGATAGKPDEPDEPTNPTLVR